MNNDQKNRIREIQKRKQKREMQRKRIMRCVFGVAAILLAVIIAAVAKSCSAPENNVVEVSVSPSPTASTKRQVDAEFYKDTCFVGNAFVKDLEYFDFIDGADYVCDDNLDVTDVLENEPEGESVSYIDKLNSNKTYKKIFMMFGEKELAWSDSDKFISEYKKVINKAKKYQPDAVIYLISVTPVSEEIDDAAKNGITISNIEKMNKRIKQLAKDTNVIYCDVFDTIANSRGYLSESASSDGIHFEESYYEKTLVYIQKNYTKEALERAEESSEKDDKDDDTNSSSNDSKGSSNSGGSSSGSNKSGSSGSSSGSSGNTSNSSGSSSSSSSGSNSSSGSSNKSNSNSGSSSSSSNKGTSSSSGSSNSSSSSNGSSNSGSSNSSKGNGSSSSSSNGNSNGSSSSSSNTTPSSSTTQEQPSGNSSGGALSMDLDE